MNDTISGGCLCGEIRFETTRDPGAQLLCYCTDCQTVSGSACYAAYVVPRDALNLIKGEPGAYEVTADSGRINRRRFCRQCGTRVWAEIDALDVASINGMALDERDHFRPISNHRSTSAPDWCQIDTSLADT